MKKELTQEDLIVQEKKAEILNTVEDVSLPPANYIKVKLSSCGKLSAPAILHFRNYSMSEAFDMAKMTEENRDEVIIDVLNHLVFEDFNCGKLHLEEVKEIMLNIYKAFWGSNLEVLKYYVDEELTGDLKEKKENTSVATIPIENIVIKDLIPEFKEPFFLGNGTHSIGFILPKVENSIIAKNYVEELFAVEESRFSTIRYHLEYNRSAPNDRQKDINFKELKALHKFNRIKVTEKLRILQALMLHSIDDRVLETLEEKYEEAGKIDLRRWEEFNHIIEDKLNFGVNQEVKFICSVTKKEITRRFRFRELDFVPPVDSKRDSEYTLSFG